MLVWSIFTPLALETKAINLGQGYMKQVYTIYIIGPLVITIFYIYTALLLLLLYKTLLKKLLMLSKPTNTGTKLYKKMCAITHC